MTKSVKSSKVKQTKPADAKLPDAKLPGDSIDKNHKPNMIIGDSIGKNHKSNMIIGDYSVRPDDVFLVGDAEIDSKGLVHHHITSANDLYEIGIPQIITQVFPIDLELRDVRRNTTEEKEIDYVHLEIKFTDVFISKPTMMNYNSSKEEILFPNMALQKEKTYKANLRINATIKATAHLTNGLTHIKEDKVENFKLCKIPIMVKSRWCNTVGLTDEALIQLHEDPQDPGGYFIIKGVEWAIDCVENILFNKVRIFRNEGYGKEIARAEFISKPGDFYLNSDQFIVRWLNDGQITVEIRRDKLKDIQIPFYLLFRILGWADDKSIFDNIVFGYDDATSKNMMNYIMDAFQAKYPHLGKAKYIYAQLDVLQYVAEEMRERGFAYLDLSAHPENYQKVIKYVLERIDNHFLQHIGTSIESRVRKMRFLCLILRKMFLVMLGNMEQTDRDSYNSKRIAAAGTSYAKSFKTYFNASIIQQIKRKLTKDFKTMSFFQIELGATFKTSVFAADFERSITQAITAGNKSQITVSKRVRINRLSSQLLSHKNQLNVFSTLRQVTASGAESAKQSERASEMRRVHMSAHGYICNIHSPEGEKGGLNKQLALFAYVTKASFSEVIKQTLLDDVDVVPLMKVSAADIEARELSNVYVNGDWIGCCKNAISLVNKYRAFRRALKISPEITIVWDNTQDEAYFWTDVGRCMRPLLIVYNNKRDVAVYPAKGAFRQGLALTQEHVDLLYAKKIDSEYLLVNGVIEYIAPEEQENYWLAASYELLRANQVNELMEFTHCDIPESQLGLTALISPFADHNQMARIIYETNQAKQTCGMFARNWPYRCDKDTFLQYNCEMPITPTVFNKYLYPNGANCIVAIACYTSLILGLCYKNL